MDKIKPSSQADIDPRNKRYTPEYLNRAGKARKTINENHALGKSFIEELRAAQEKKNNAL